MFHLLFNSGKQFLAGVLAGHLCDALQYHDLFIDLLLKTALLFIQAGQSVCDFLELVLYLTLLLAQCLIAEIETVLAAQQFGFLFGHFLPPFLDFLLGFHLQVVCLSLAVQHSLLDPGFCLTFSILQDLLRFLLIFVQTCLRNPPHDEDPDCKTYHNGRQRSQKECHILTPPANFCPQSKFIILLQRLLEKRGRIWRST